MKLQDAFIAENGDFYGSFAKIGYEMDATTNFNYTSSLTSGTAALTAAQGEEWKATSKSALNDCTSGSEWILNLSASSTGNGAAWTTNASSLGDACMALTPRFNDFARGTAAASGNGG
ncbi:hypothetical protein [Fibrobacter succinogenes]|uniref:hypothetical protein n=1 Tax=Fibrobacter succinogenes TaxID=833 RepID=UPI001566D729|nr:hypothetical protein [Fibrobacter succinogenes]